MWSTNPSTQECEDLSTRLTNVGSNINTQTDLDEANIQQESIPGSMKRKQGDAIAEMFEQIDALGKMKSKTEKDKGRIMNETADERAATDEVMRAQASSDKSNKTTLEALNAIKSRPGAKGPRTQSFSKVLKRTPRSSERRGAGKAQQQARIQRGPNPGPSS